MSATSHWEVNVSYRGSKGRHHVFATAQRSGESLTKEGAYTLYSLIKSKFPENEGYRVTLTHWECGGEDYTQDAENFIRFEEEGASNEV